MTTGLQLFSTMGSNETLKLSLDKIDIPAPKSEEIVIRIEASPINPTDLASMFGPADLTTLRNEQGEDSTELLADIPSKLMRMVKSRIDSPLATGSEGAGVVIEAGDSPEAQALIGKVVSVATGGHHGQYCCVDYSLVNPMPEGITPEQAASAFVNPMTALGLVETMHREGHKALVNTAAASNLGIMLNRICQADSIDIVNIVRKPEQEEILKEIGAQYIVNSSSETFRKDLFKALAETGATIAFDAIGGGKLGYEILACMEQVAASQMTSYNHYGSSVKKQLYTYGRLDLRPTVINAGLGFAWNVGGWLLFNFLADTDSETIQRMYKRVADEITTTFASHYAKKISLEDAISVNVVAEYGRMATGEKYLILPHSQKIRSSQVQNCLK
ncbi:zinc-binding dehydrogenase [Maricurvus nonylphenolicus]|uniref:zinc-binding dehydrogenase n=1 Tax=Maricurvus nonylphenolicus TaxID=1008307 RepID=UPI0036F40FDD